VTSKKHKKGSKTEESCEAAEGVGALEKIEENGIVERLQKEVETLSEKNAELEDRYLRIAAEFDNYKKRQKRIFGEMVDAAHDALILKILDILDNFERAIESSEKPLDPDGVIEGVELIYSQMLDMLASENIESICPEGECFDPNVHEAVSVVPCDKEEGRVLDVVRKGYRKGDRLIRPARVVVSAPKSEEDE